MSLIFLKGEIYFTRLIHCFRVLGLRLLGVDVGVGVQTFGPVKLWRYMGQGLRLGDRVVLSASRWANPISRGLPNQFSLLKPNAKISIGRDSGITSTVIAAAESVTIGERVLIGAGCLICDTDFHLIDPQGRRHYGFGPKVQVSAVDIGSDVWLGAGVTVLKGVSIGNGTVVAAGSVVVSDIPPNVLCGGIPAKVLRAIESKAAA